jgi:hypothetical protein
MKSLCLLTRRAGTTREAFRDYYETQHCRLGMKYFPFAKYLRNHVVAASVDIDFDCVSEFYFDAGRGGADLMATSVGDILRADERKFMDQGLIRPAVAEESILAGPPRDVAAPGAQRQLLMLDPAVGATDEVFFAALRDWGLALGAAPGVMRVSLDRTTPFAPGAAGFRWRAMLSLWLAPGAAPVPIPAPPLTLALGVALLVDACESPPELIRALYAPESN